MKTTYFRIIAKIDGAFAFRTSKLTAAQALDLHNRLAAASKEGETLEILQVTGAPVGQIIEFPALAGIVAEGAADMKPGLDD